MESNQTKELLYPANLGRTEFDSLSAAKAESMRWRYADIIVLIGDRYVLKTMQKTNLTFWTERQFGKKTN